MEGGKIEIRTASQDGKLHTADDLVSVYPRDEEAMKDPFYGMPGD